MTFLKKTKISAVIDVTFAVSKRKPEASCFGPTVKAYLPAILVDGSKSFSFRGCSLIRIVSSTTPGSVSLVHGFTHDKSVPRLFSTCLGSCSEALAKTL